MRVFFWFNCCALGIVVMLPLLNAAGLTVDGLGITVLYIVALTILWLSLFEVVLQCLWNLPSVTYYRKRRKNRETHL